MQVSTPLMNGILHWNLSDRKCPQLSRNLLNSDFNCTEVSRVSKLPWISCFPSLRTLIMTGFNVTFSCSTGFKVCFFFHSNGKAKAFLSSFSFSFNLTRRYSRTEKLTIRQILYFLLIEIRSGFLV